MFNIFFGEKTVALLVLMRPEGFKFFLPETNGGRPEIEHLGYFSNRVI
jgi:hypothetical protein